MGFLYPSVSHQTPFHPSCALNTPPWREGVMHIYVQYGVCSASCSIYLTLFAHTSSCSLAWEFSLPFVKFFSSNNPVTSNLRYACSYRSVKKKILFTHRIETAFFLNTVRRMLPVPSAPVATSLQRLMDFSQSKQKDSDTLEENGGLCIQTEKSLSLMPAVSWCKYKI